MKNPLPPQAPSMLLPVAEYNAAQETFFLRTAQQSNGKRSKIAVIGWMLSVLLQGENLHHDQQMLLQEAIDDLRKFL